MMQETGAGVILCVLEALSAAQVPSTATSMKYQAGMRKPRRIRPSGIALD